jgi:hypothetical protein
MENGNKENYTQVLTLGGQQGLVDNTYIIFPKAAFVSVFVSHWYVEDFT